MPRSWLLLAIGVCALISAGCSRSDVEAWCEKRADETAAKLSPVYRPSAAEADRGRAAFVRECVKNQGY
jgi:hypothetical protein